MNSNYPDYISSPTTLPVPPGPYHFRNAQMAVFYLDANLDRLQSICDLYLNHSSEDEDKKYVVDSAKVFVVFLSMEFRTTIDPPTIGWIPENEVSFWIKFKGRPLSPFIAFSPYLFLDDFYAIALGREVYGFRKQQGQFTIPEPLNISAPEVEIKTVGFKELNPDAVAQMEYLVY